MHLALNVVCGSVWWPLAAFGLSGHAAFWFLLLLGFPLCLLYLRLWTRLRKLPFTGSPHGKETQFQAAFESLDDFWLHKHRLYRGTCWRGARRCCCQKEPKAKTRAIFKELYMAAQSPYRVSQQAPIDATINYFTATGTPSNLADLIGRSPDDDFKIFLLVGLEAITRQRFHSRNFRSRNVEWIDARTRFLAQQVGLPEARHADLRQELIKRELFQVQP